MNVAKGELEISTESSPALQTHISSCPSSTPPGCLLSFSCLQMTPPSLHTVSPFQSFLNLAARVRLLQSQSIAPEANIIFYVNYTSRKKSQSNQVTPFSKPAKWLPFSLRGKPTSSQWVPSLRDICTPWPQLLWLPCCISVCRFTRHPPT